MLGVAWFGACAIQAGCIEPQPQLGCQPYLDAEPDVQWVLHAELDGPAPALDQWVYLPDHLYASSAGPLCELRGCGSGAFLTLDFGPESSTTPFELVGQADATLHKAGDYCEQPLQPQPSTDWRIRFDVWEPECVMGEFINLGPEFEHLEGRFYMSLCG